MCFLITVIFQILLGKYIIISYSNIIFEDLTVPN